MPSKDKKAAEEIVTKLRFKGPIPNLQEAKKDPAMGTMNEDALALARRRTSVGMKKTCEIDDSLQERMDDGNSLFH